MLLSILLQIPNAVDSANAAQSAAATAQIPDNLWSLAVKGGVVMIPIGLMFVFSLYLAIERYLTIRNAAKIEAALAQDAERQKSIEAEGLSFIRFTNEQV